jgi:hypothetical protein
LCGSGQQIERGPVLAFEAPAFGRGESLGWDLEGGQIVQGLAYAAETFLEPDAEGPEGGARRVGAYALEWLSEQRGALARGGGTEARDEGQALLRAQAVALCGSLERLLLFVRQSAKRVGDRGADLAVVELALQDRRQAPHQEAPS